MTEQLDDRGRRIGLNEALFREVNERLEDLAQTFDLTKLDLICECGFADCDQRITMSAEEYERVRSEPTHFAISPGHEIADVETIVARQAGYVVVVKREGEAAELARSMDPRS